MNGSDTTVNVWVEEIDAYGGYFLYRVWNYREKYNTFICKPRLTRSQITDVENLYSEALTYWSD